MQVFGGRKQGVVLVRELQKAEKLIEILCYMFLAPRQRLDEGITVNLVNVLAKKISEGVQVLILSNDKFPSGWLKRRIDEERKRLRAVGINVKSYSRENMLHSKMILIDRKVAILGSMNLTAESMMKNHEIIIKLDEEKAVKRCSEIFFQAWSENVRGD